MSNMPRLPDAPDPPKKKYDSYEVEDSGCLFWLFILGGILAFLTGPWFKLKFTEALIALAILLAVVAVLTLAFYKLPEK